MVRYNIASASTISGKGTRIAVLKKSHTPIFFLENDKTCIIFLLFLMNS